MNRLFFVWSILSNNVKFVPVKNIAVNLIFFMDFNFFLTHISKLQKLPLGGLESQFKMAPVVRKNFTLKMLKEKKTKESAVLALCYPDKDYCCRILLMLRASYNGTHSSQISFPGGKKEKGDINLEATALRETEEEVGIEKTTINIVRQLTKTYIPPSNFWVTPYLATIDYTPEFKTNEEVETLIEVPFSDLLHKNSLGQKNLSTSYMQNIDVPCFKLNNYVVWGATAMMLSEIKDLYNSL